MNPNRIPTPSPRARPATLRLSILAAAFALGAWPASAQGQDEQEAAAPDRVIGGPEGVSSQLEEQAEREATYRFNNFQRWASPYYDWKGRLEEDHGLSFGFTAHLLYQNATETLGSEDQAAGGIYRFQGKWNVLGRGTGHPGRIEWRVEHRGSISGEIAPGAFGAEVGSAALSPGFVYNDDHDLDLSVINWTQSFNDQRAGFAVGRLAFDAYLDAFMFQTPSRGFINRAFVVNPTLGTTGVGALGAVAKGFVGDQFWIGAQAHDANAVSGEFDLDTVEENEWLKGLEIGWSPSVERYKTDRVQLTWWEKDARDLAGTSQGDGWALSTSWRLSEEWVSFARFGHSDGGAGVAAETAASGGLEWSPRIDQTLSLGAGWAEPSELTYGPGLRDEYVLESSYRFQLSPNLSLTPDVQFLLDPANNPAEDSTWVLGLRAIVSI